MTDAGIAVLNVGCPSIRVAEVGAYEGEVAMTDNKCRCCKVLEPAVPYDNTTVDDVDGVGCKAAKVSSSNDCTAIAALGRVISQPQESLICMTASADHM